MRFIFTEPSKIPSIKSTPQYLLDIIIKPVYGFSRMSKAGLLLGTLILIAKPS